MNDYDTLMEKRNDLVGKKYDVGLTKSEAAKLEDIRHRLDVLEDAQSRDEFDRLEMIVESLERIRATMAEGLPEDKGPVTGDPD